jgi:WD40 repeat protein
MSDPRDGAAPHAARTVVAAVAEVATLPPNADGATTRVGDGRGDETTFSGPAGASAPAAVEVEGYAILGELGRGGMGVVYRAQQLRLNRLVALKMILAGAHAGAEERSRFLAEAEAVAHLQHPNIVQIHEIGDSGGLPYFSLEYVDGSALDRTLDGTPWPPEAAATLIETLAGAMHAAHRKGIVHRDLKPGNVLIAADGTPKITDFGLAKRLDSDKGQTRTGAVMGSPSYMAPEQAGGKTKEIGPLADVYALGAILYELLTGRPPFRAATPLETVVQVVSAEPVPPGRLQPGLPRDLETICQKCLEKDPRKRYDDAEALARDLTHFRAGEPIEARPIGPIGRTAKWVKRHPDQAGLLLVLALVIVVGLVLTGSQYQRAVRQKDRAERQRQRAEDQKARAERFLAAANTARAQAEAATKAVTAAKAKTDTQLYATSIALASQDWLAGDVTHAQHVLAQCPPKLRAWEWDYLNGLGRAGQMTLRTYAGPVWRAAFAAGGRHIVGASAAPFIRIWDAQRGFPLGQRGAEGAPLAIGADGRLVASSLGSSVRIQGLETGSGPRILSAGAGVQFLGGIAGVGAFRPDGKHFAVGGTDQAIHIWDLADGKEVRTLRGHVSPPPCLAYRPDGRRLASAVASLSKMLTGDDSAEIQAEICLWDPEAGALVRRWPVPAGGIHRLAFSPDGKRVVSAGMDGTVRLWDAEEGRELAVLRGHNGFVYAVAFSPDGTLVASGAWDRTVRVWDVAGARELAALRGHDMMVVDVAFSPDGRRLLSSALDGTVRVWDVAPSGSKPALEPGDLSQEYRTLRGHTGATSAVAFSPDGTTLLSGGWDGLVNVWDAASGRLVRTFRGHKAPISSVEVSSDGTRVLSASGGLLGTRPGEAKLWDLETGRELATFHAGSAPIVMARLGPDGARVATATGGFYWNGPNVLKIWDAASGRELAATAGRHPTLLALAFTPDSRNVASVGLEPGIRFWDVATGKPAGPALEPGAVFRALAYSRDGSLLAAARMDGSVVVWDAATRRPAWTLPGHSAGTYAIGFSPDRRRLASAGSDAAVKIWDLENGQELLSLRQHDHEVYAVTFDHTGRTLVSCGYDGTIKLRSVKPGAAVRAEEWPVAFADRFDRAELGDRWAVKSGRWSIEGGALRGELGPKVGNDVTKATIVPKGLLLGDLVEVRYDVWSPEPMVVEAKFVADAQAHGLLSLLVGLTEPALNGGKPGTVLMTRIGDYQPVASSDAPVFRRGMHHRVRVVREPRQLTLFVDGTERLTAEVPGLDVPELELQGSWAPAGSVVYFDNVEVRAPNTPAGHSDTP